MGSFLVVCLTGAPASLAVKADVELTVSVACFCLADHDLKLDIILIEELLWLSNHFFAKA